MIKKRQFSGSSCTEGSLGPAEEVICLWHQQSFNLQKKCQKIQARKVCLVKVGKADIQARETKATPVKGQQSKMLSNIQKTMILIMAFIPSLYFNISIAPLQKRQSYRHLCAINLTYTANKIEDTVKKRTINQTKSKDTITLMEDFYNVNFSLLLLSQIDSWTH